MMARVIALRALLMTALWWVLTGGRTDAWGLGLAVIALSVLASLRLQPTRAFRLSVAGMLGFIAFFVAGSLKAGLQVALMALRPRLDLQPVMLELQLRLPGEAQRLFLAGVVSLMPGTLSTGLEGKRLQLHLLDRRLPVEAEVRSAEAHVARMFRVELQ